MILELWHSQAHGTKPHPNVRGMSLTFLNSSSSFRIPRPVGVHKDSPGGPQVLSSISKSRRASRHVSEVGHQTEMSGLFAHDSAFASWGKYHRGGPLGT